MSAWDDIVSGLDPDRQLPAVRETRSAVVSAGAGSGKTRVLAVRYLHLVKERGIPPERILCLTFTKKAAAEMSERIRSMLAACAADDDDFARALEAFPASRVSTLDSFCAEVARSGCPRWGVAPDFAVDKDPDALSLRALAIDFLLERRKDPITASFLAASGFENAADALVSLAGGREGLIASGRRFDPAGQAAVLSTHLDYVHLEIRTLMTGGLGLDPGTAKGTKAWQERAGMFPASAPHASVAADMEDYLTHCRFLYSLRVATGTSEAAEYYNPAGKRIKPLAAIASLICEALLDGRRPGALAMLRDFTAAAADARAASGSLSFADVASIALRTLETDLALRDWYKSRYDAIMVDEFQDDNDLQKRILFAIAERRDRTGAGRGQSVAPEDLEPGVLFFVGDEKQSIYAFRGADVTVFRGLSNELAGAPGGLGAHSLDINWRSEPDLIDFFNRTFSRVLPAPGAPFAAEYEARFTPLQAGPATPGAEPAVVYLESNEPEDDDGVSSGEAEAWRIAELALSLVKDKVPVAAKGPGGAKISRPCQWDDIAVLFRSTTSQNVVERYFRLLGVPYTAASTAGLFAESILGDLYAMLRLAVYPDDRLAFAAVLRGPFARLSDDAAFAALSPGADGPEGLMGFDPAGLHPDDAARFDAARETWRGVRAIADREPLRRVVEYLWYGRGLRWNVLKDPAASSFLEHFDYAWSLAQAADARGERLVDLVASLEPRIGEVERFDEAVLRESSRGVSIMTVHMSKGLEFPVVILPDVEARGRSGTRSPIAPSGRFGPSVRLLDRNGDPADPLADLEAAVRKFERGDGDDAMDETLAETARLFYVATTRAISRLYLVGKVPGSADKAGQSFRGLFLRAWPWAGPASEGDDEFLSDRPDDAPDYLEVEYVPARTKAEYGKLANAALADGPARAAASAAAPAKAVAERRGRWSVTGAAAWLEASGCIAYADACNSNDASGAAGSSAATVDELKSVSAGAVDSGAGREVSAPERAAQGELPFAASFTDADAGPGLQEADFGTLCHQFIESRLRRPGEEPEARGSVARALDRLPAGVGRREREAALALADAFVRSARGSAAAAARDAVAAGVPGAVFETEYPFVYRSIADAGLPVVLSGGIDLVYGDAAGVVVVDFKTDRRIEPERHAFQLSVYREAAESLFGVPAQACVHYLRTGTERMIEGTPDMARLGAYAI